MNYISAAVVAEVRAEMARQRKTVVALAAESGITYPTLRRRLSDDGQLTLDELAQVALPLGVRASELVRRATDKDAA